MTEHEPKRDDKIEYEPARDKRTRKEAIAKRVVAIAFFFVFAAVTVKLCVDPSLTKRYPSPLSDLTRIPASIWLSAAATALCLLIAVGRIR